jgi:hypothetical protein
VSLCHIEPPAAPAPKKIVQATATAKNAFITIRQKTKSHTAQGNREMPKDSDTERQKKRQKVQVYFWNIVGAVEHISLPKIEDMLKKEFNTEDDRFIEAQVKLMQTEARIRIQSNVKVWIKKPAA